jgi:hypothetical protein
MNANRAFDEKIVLTAVASEFKHHKIGKGENTHKHISVNSEKKYRAE